MFCYFYTDPLSIEPIIAPTGPSFLVFILIFLQAIIVFNCVCSNHILTEWVFLFKSIIERTTLSASCIVDKT